MLYGTKHRWPVISEFRSTDRSLASKQFIRSWVWPGLKFQRQDDCCRNYERDGIRSKSHVYKVTKINLTSLLLMGMMTLAVTLTWTSSKCWQRPLFSDSSAAAPHTVYLKRQKNRSFHSLVLRKWNVFSNTSQSQPACHFPCLWSGLRAIIVSLKCYSLFAKLESHL